MPAISTMAYSQAHTVRLITCGESNASSDMVHKTSQHLIKPKVYEYFSENHTKLV